MNYGNEDCIDIFIYKKLNSLCNDIEYDVVKSLLKSTMVENDNGILNEVIYYKMICEEKLNKINKTTENFKFIYDIFLDYKAQMEYKKDYIREISSAVRNRIDVKDNEGNNILRYSKKCYECYESLKIDMTRSYELLKNYISQNCPEITL